MDFLESLGPLLGLVIPAVIFVAISIIVIAFGSEPYMLSASVGTKPQSEPMRRPASASAAMATRTPQPIQIARETADVEIEEPETSDLDDYEYVDNAYVKKTRTFPISEYDKALRGGYSKDWDNQGGW